MNSRHICLPIILLSFAFFAGGQALAAQAAKLDLNSAPQASLAQLPGINNAQAAKIVANRPFNTVNDLAKVGITSSLLLEKIAERVTQPFDKARALQTGGAGGNGDWGNNAGRR